MSNNPTVRERIVMLETKMDNLKDKVDEGFGSVNVKLDDFIDNADKKYASKLTERIVYAMVGIILLAVLYLILTRVGIKL